MKRLVCSSKNILLSFALLAIPVVAHGATRTWSAVPVNGNWSVPTNWVEGITPVAGDDLVFPPVSSIKAVVNDLSAGILINSIAFTGNGYTITGNAFTLGATGVSCTTFLSPQTNYIQVPIALAANSAFTLVSGCQVELHAAVSGAFGFTFTNGVLLLRGANTFTGAITASSGLLVVDSNGALGAGDGTPATGTTINSGAGVVVQSPSSVANEWISINGTGSPGSNTGSFYNNGTASWGGPIVLAGNTQIGATAAIFTVSGPISGPGNLTKLNNATLAMTGANTYTGTTTVSAGTLLINGSTTGSASATVAAGSVLGGSGTFTGTLNASGAIQPGNSPGLLSTGSTTFLTGSTYGVELNGTTAGTQYDQLRVTGAVSLTGTALTTTLGFVPIPGQQFTIIDNDGSDAVSGTFTGLAQGASFVSGGTTFTISYAGGSGNDVVLTVASVVPTMPLPFWLGLAGLLLLVAIARLRRPAGA